MVCLIIIKPVGSMLREEATDNTRLSANVTGKDLIFSVTPNVRRVSRGRDHCAGVYAKKASLVKASFALTLRESHISRRVTVEVLVKDCNAMHQRRWTI